MEETNKVETDGSKSKIPSHMLQKNVSKLAVNWMKFKIFLKIYMYGLWL